MNRINSVPLLILAALGLFLLAPAKICALDLSIYAQESRLSSGRWIKISVEESGVYKLTPVLLRSLGFSDPARVRVFGYGGARIPDLLTAENYIDDLPETPSEYTDKGVVFYAVGPETWREATAGRYMAIDNIYTTKGYYFLTDSAEGDRLTPTSGGFPVESDVAVRTFNARLRHEQNLTSASENGWLMVGEDFRFTPTRTFNFDMTDRVEGTPVWLQTSMVANCPSRSSLTMSVTANGETLPAESGDVIREVTESGVDGREGVARRTFLTEGVRLNLTLTAKPSGTLKSAMLNYIVVNYTRELKLPDTFLSFSLPTTSARLSADRTEGIRVWDVTLPLSVRSMQLTASAGPAVAWTNDFTGLRNYVAWSPESVLPEPTVEGEVASQNLHAMSTPDMVIVTPRELRQEALRLASMHSSGTNQLTVAVVTDTDIYNEFSSGAPDVSGLRKFFKMLYDRGDLRYALLLGAASYDNRRLTDYIRRNKIPVIPSYYGGTAAIQLSENDAYGTDDFVAMLDDGSGSRMAYDRLSIAVGRIPARSISEASATVDKILAYQSDNKRTSWKQQMVLVADDGNSAEHMRQADAMAEQIVATEANPINVNKIYIDAYELSGGVYEGARTEMYRLLNEGAVWWAFIGHANTTSWTGEGILTYKDINSLYVKHPPMLFAATCEFLRWDSNVTSGCELLFHERNGGIIGAVSATRPVYISLNKYVASAMGASMAERDEAGRLLPVGEIYRRAKNRVSELDIAGSNHRRYVLMGDPALRLPVPDYVAVLDSIGSETVGSEQPPVVEALSRKKFSGRITDFTGRTVDDFDGVILATVNDAESSVTTNGNSSDDDTGVHIFEKQGDRLFSGAGKVSGGRFEVNVSMPAEIADNYRPAQFLMYAYSEGSGAEVREAAGQSRDFYVYGYDDSAETDIRPPVISTCVLNHDSFTDGDYVNPTPMLIARISDDIGINLSSSGIGHSLTIVIDGNQMLTDVPRFYTPSSDGTPAGVIAYPLPELTPGEHSLMLRVWDTSANSAESKISFKVREGLSPTIFDVFSDTNPASECARFYVSHNRPDELLTVKVTVHDLMGREIWSDVMTSRSDMTLSTPLTWNLCDKANRRVGRGIYLYRAEITTPDGGFSTASKRIAVTAR